MPSSLFMENSVQGDALNDQRALQIALDQLCLLDLDNEENSVCFDIQETRKKSVNMTECIPVPSSEHVAEIVGRQGCKIKALRAKTNTYIKTPVRGEEPVFVVTGRREDVAMARREIISAAEHFSMIRASRNKNNSFSRSSTPGPGPSNLPGQTTIQVRVPYRVVGLVVGPKGATIKRIQAQTHTYIVTPSRDKEPVFEVIGMPENVDRAREEIEAHIAMRTGGLTDFQDDNDFHENGKDVGINLHGQWSKPSTERNPASIRKTFSNYRNDSSSSLGSASSDSYFGYNSSHTADYSPSSPALSFTSSNNNNNNNNNNISVNTNMFVSGGEVISPDCTDQTFDSSAGFESTQIPVDMLWSQYDGHLTLSSFEGSPPSSTSAMFPNNTTTNANSVVVNQKKVNECTTQLSPPSPIQCHTRGPTEHPLTRRVRSDSGGGPLSFLACPTDVESLQGSQIHRVAWDSSSSSSTSSSTSRKGSRDCSVCFESEVIAALVPCGHNLFCLECANQICKRNEPLCPVCHTVVTQAIRIFP